MYFFRHKARWYRTTILILFYILIIVIELTHSKSIGNILSVSFHWCLWDVEQIAISITNALRSLIWCNINIIIIYNISYIIGCLTTTVNSIAMQLSISWSVLHCCISGHHNYSWLPIIDQFKLQYLQYWSTYHI